MNDKINELIQLLNNSGYKTRSEKAIDLDFKCNDKKIDIMYDDNFKLQLDVENDKLSLETTYSNQKIDGEFMKKINYLYDRMQYYNV